MVTLVILVLWVRVRMITIASLYRSTLTKEDKSSINDDACPPWSVERGKIYGDRRIPAYERTGIVIPDRSEDTIDCDDYENARECSVDHGFDACFACAETRLSLRVCAHVPENVSVIDFATGAKITLRANSSENKGYCVRESVARDLRGLHDYRDRLRDDRLRCSAYNAEWLLVRRRTLGDSTYNFQCRCKYPHLLTNESGPQSACSVDVACNGRGRLDEKSRIGHRDPFANGRCLCDDGWIGEHDPRTVGPYCREATFEEWPSALFGVKRRVDDLNLHSDRVSDEFAARVKARRVDGDRAVWLPNPCREPCSLRQADNGAWFCADGIIVKDERLIRVGVAVTRDRDYLRGNGGSLPNACLELSDYHSTIVALQYSSRVRKRPFAQELGILVLSDWARRITNGAWLVAAPGRMRYRDWADGLLAPENRTLDDYGVVWSNDDAALETHRRDVNESLGGMLQPARTNLSYGSVDPERFWFPFAFYKWHLMGNQYHRANDNAVALYRDYNTPALYDCPDERGLDEVEPLERDEFTDYETAHEIARSMCPVCYATETRIDGTTYRYPVLNCKHVNETACVLFVNGKFAIYAKAFHRPRNMNMIRFCDERNDDDDDGNDDTATVTPSKSVVSQITRRL